MKLVSFCLLAVTLVRLPAAASDLEKVVADYVGLCRRDALLRMEDALPSSFHRRLDPRYLEKYRVNRT
jgi:hypothetical protein